MKVLFIATVVKTHIMEFHLPYLKMVKDMGGSTAVAARNDYDDPSDCQIPYCDNYYDIPFERSPIKSNNVKAYIKLKQIIDEGQFDIIHCHTPVGAFVGRLASIKARKKKTKVFYTAHGFHFYKDAPLINWAVYYPVERILARKTDVLVTINKEDYLRATKFKANKIVWLPGVGIDLSRFTNRYSQRKQLRKGLGISPTDIVILSVGELIQRKNHLIVLKALSILLKDGAASNIKYIICGQGILERELKEKAVELGVDKHVMFLGYRNDIADICNMSDMFVFMSLQEGLPVALMEAMASGLPVICSKIRGNTDLVENNKQGLLVDQSPDELAKCIRLLCENEDLCLRLSNNAVTSIQNYEVSNVVKKMQRLYLEAVEKQ